MKITNKMLLTSFISLGVIGCGSSGSGDNTSTPTTTNILQTSHFRSFTSSSTISCQLSNGSTTTCHRLVFNVNNIVDGADNSSVNDEAGPFCPSTKSSTNGGLGAYDGASGRGLDQLSSTLWDYMATDGYDLIDDSNTVCTQDLFAGTRTGTQSQCNANCLENSVDNSLTATFLIPVTPENLSSVDVINSIESVGLSLDGVPIVGEPPSVTGNSGNIPALDPCGGHHDPSGYYHWHFVPESMDTVLAGKSITAVNCATQITQVASALTGYAKDGYPIYAYQDAGGTPTDLDECNGHTGVTTEFPNGVYHYHAAQTVSDGAVTSTSVNVSLPPCLKGASVDRSLSPIIE